MERTPTQIRFREGLYDQIKDRAAAGDMSINEWVNRACEYALLKGGTELTTVVTTVVTL